EPTQGAPTPVLRRAAEVTRDGTGLGYSPIFGIPELREAIAGHYRNWYGLTVPPERIAVTTGSSGAFQTTFLTCFDRSEEHTSELQSRFDLVCRLLLEKKKKIYKMTSQLRH